MTGKDALIFIASFGVAIIILTITVCVCAAIVVTFIRLLKGKD